MSHFPDSYRYQDLPSPFSFRLAELLPGEEGDPVTCLLHVAEWPDLPDYGALSYAWGDLNARATITCEGKRIEVTQSLYGGLAQVRYKDRSRLLFADALW